MKQPPLEASPAVRGKVKERDGWTCVACGSGRNLTIGHRVNRSTVSRKVRNTYANLITQCLDCNVQETANADLARQFREWGHNLRSWEIPLEVAVYFPAWGQWRLFDNEGRWKLVGGRNP